MAHDGLIIPAGITEIVNLLPPAFSQRLNRGYETGIKRRINCVDGFVFKKADQ